VQNPRDLPRLTDDQILAWAEAHRERAGRWPSLKSGAVIDAPEETWARVQSALHFGLRGLPGGSSLARLLQTARGASNLTERPRFSEEEILRWVDAHYERTGHWPTPDSGPIPESICGDTWGAVEAAIRLGARGLPGRSSLARLLQRERGGSSRSDRSSLAGGGTRISAERTVNAPP
jgi:hypothetical protein